MKTIFFDFGNVIAFFDHRKAVEKLLRHTDCTSEELIVRLYNAQIERQYEAGFLSTPEYVRIARDVGRLRCSEREFLEAYVDIFERNHEVCEIIPRLSNRYRIMLASNTNEAHYLKYVEQFADVFEHFDHHCPSHHVGARKPDPEYFLRCQLHADADPTQCLFVDDLEENVEAARRHGWQAILYRADGSLKKKLIEAGVELAANH